MSMSFTRIIKRAFGLEARPVQGDLAALWTAQVSFKGQAGALIVWIMRISCHSLMGQMEEFGQAHLAMGHFAFNLIAK
ncbi:hypothetical protein L0337_10235 [candidate division KSB1 bacterium]|nr:hypothetical protein [candidate division KSB1 bacterium]